MNTIILKGRLTRDPEIIKTSEGKTVASYDLAVNYYNRGEDKVFFITCVSFGSLAEVAEKYFNKGTSILVKGGFIIEDWTDKEGNKHKTPKVIVESQEFCEKKES